MSWDEEFADRYEEWSAHMTADVAFYTELEVKADGPLVELAIGNGRVAIPVARATGQRVVGIDSSPAMLDQARSRAPRQAWSSTCARATCVNSRSTSRRR
jgi:ubiquinone/menaquinone biosynthesis C-methylase UbiE